MKKYITLAALLAAGTTFANAEDSKEYTGDFAWTSGSLPTFTFDETEDLVLTIGSVMVDGSASTTPKSNSVYANTLTPDTNIGNGGKWEFTFTIANNGTETLTLGSITFDAFAYNGQGSAQNADFLQRDITFALTGAADVSVVHSFTNVDAETDVYNWDTNPTLTFASPVEIAADSSKTFTLTVEEYTSVGCFIGLSGLTLSTPAPIPEPSAFGMLAGLGALALVAARRRRK